MFSGSTFKLLNSFTDKSTNNEEKTPATLESSFVFFDLNLSLEQKYTLTSLKISKNNEFENSDNFENIVTDIEKFISALDSENATISIKIAQLIFEIIKAVISEMHQETAWIVMRASQPNDLFKYPRWHTDGCYFPPHQGEQFKVVVTLAGPGTLFYNLPDTQREAFNLLDNDRAKTLKMLQGIKPETPAAGQGAVFIAGSQTRAAVHSEPHINSPRLFLAIAPCSRSQLNCRFESQKEFQRKLMSDPAFLKQIEELKKRAFSAPSVAELTETNGVLTQDKEERTAAKPLEQKSGSSLRSYSLYSIEPRFDSNNNTRSTMAESSGFNSVDTPALQRSSCMSLSFRR